MNFISFFYYLYAKCTIDKTICFLTPKITGIKRKPVQSKN